MMLLVARVPLPTGPTAPRSAITAQPTRANTTTLSHIEAQATARMVFAASRVPGCSATAS